MDKIGKERSRDGANSLAQSVSQLNGEIHGLNGQVKDAEVVDNGQTLRPFSIQGKRIGEPVEASSDLEYKAPAEMTNIASRRLIPATGDHTKRDFVHKMHAHRVATLNVHKNKAA